MPVDKMKSVEEADETRMSQPEVRKDNKHNNPYEPDEAAVIIQKCK